MKGSRSTVGEVLDRFTQEVLSGEVVGSPSDCGVMRLGLDAEAKISVEAGGMRFAPLVTPGWGRQGIAYGPFIRQAGLALGVFMLNGHNNSQASPERPTLWQRGSKNPRTPLKAHFSHDLLLENLAVGWFDHPVSDRPLEAGQAFVMQGHPVANGRLCAAKVQGLHHLLLGIPNVPLYLLVVQRDKGAAFYAGSLEGSRHLPALPRLRPLAIDPYELGAQEVYACIYQSVLGERGYRADTRVYGVRATVIPEWQGHGTALVVDPQPQLGRKAALGGRWQLSSPGMLQWPDEPGGLFHVRLTPPASLIWRYRDPEHYLALELNPREARLCLRFGAKQYVLAAEPHTLNPLEPRWVQVLDDGQALSIILDGRPLFREGPLYELRLSQETGVGLRGQAADLEVHPREIRLPPTLELGQPWQVKGQQTVFAPYLNQASDSLLVTWEPTSGPGILTLAEGGLTIEGAGPERTAYTIPWDNPHLADLESEILPPCPHKGVQSRAGVCFWQDEKHHLVVALSLDETERAVVGMLRFAGYEDPLGRVWTNVPDRLYHGVPVRLRVVCDGEQFLAYLDDEPVLYRALHDIYPGADRLHIRRVGLALSGYAEDSGSIFRTWIARK